MIALDATKMGTDAIDPWKLASMTPDRTTNDVASTRLRRCDSGRASAHAVLRDALERDDRQVLPAGAILDRELDHGTRPSSNECLRSGARRLSRQREWRTLAEIHRVW